jgi:hypothetical protein
MLLVNSGFLLAGLLKQRCRGKATQLEVMQVKDFSPIYCKQSKNAFCMYANANADAETGKALSR